MCGICGKPNQNFLCPKCNNKLKKQAKFKIEEKSPISHYFKEHLYIIRSEILDYKFNDKSYLYKTFVNFLLKSEKFFKILKSYDTIVPVPISKKRYKERGYNQSNLIARELATQLKIEYNDKSLIKTKNVIEQSKLNKEERQKNIQGVYELRSIKKLKNKKILLVDDIYTTGNTVNECCKILTKAEPKQIDVFTLAKD